LARQGFHALALALEDRLLSAVARAGEHYELF
jgi:ABC-type spermidine/putrescine transport system permease subunit II